MDKQEFGSGRIKVNVLTILAMLSGCCGLAYEVLYVRALTAILGDMFYVHAALLSTFLVGIGLGAKLAHRWLRWLWAFEVLTGLYALGLPIASKWLSQQPVMVPITSSALLTILATIGFISVPSLLIGFSIPLFSAYIKNCLPERLSFQNVYKIYNLGAVLSILGVELVLIRHLGISRSLATIGAINLLSGAVLLLMRAAPAMRPAVIPRIFPQRCIIALAMASFGSAVFQMFFLKLSYLVFYPHRENFAIGLSVTMLGLFIGTWLVSKVRIRFETFLVLASFFIGFIYVNYLPILRFFEATTPWSKGSEFLIVAHKLAFGCLFALGPMILFGALIPALMRTESEVATESGHLLWVSSLANAAGYLVYVLIGHPLLTNGTILALIAGVMLAASLLAAGFRWSKVQGAFATGGIVLAALLILHWQERNFCLAHWVNELKPKDDVIIFKSGAESATLVRAQRIFKHKAVGASGVSESEDKNDIWEDVWISYNGHPSITVQRNGVINFAELAVGIIPALSAPRLDRVLVIGFGTGVTAGATSQVFRATDVVEINNAFYKMMSYLSHANFDIEHNPSATLHLSDGRAFLVGKDQTYDVIISTVSAPTYFSASKIYTVDFYSRVKKSLKPDGTFSAWISVADMSGAGMMTILSALRRNFRYCELHIMRAQYYLVTCSNRPIRTYRRFSELMPTNHSLTRQLQLGLPGLDLDEFFEDILLSENIFDHFTPQVLQENTDDYPVLEFMVVRSQQLRKMGKDPFTENEDLLNIDAVREQDEFKDVGRFARRAIVFWRLGSQYYEKNFQPILLREPNIASEFLMEAAEYKIIDGKPDKAIDMLTTVLRIKPDSAEAHNKMGSALAAQGKLDEAINHLRKALKIKPCFAQAHYNLGNVLASQDKLDEAIQNFRQALACNEQSELKSNMANVHYNLAMALKKLGRPQEASEQFAKAAEGYPEEIAQNPSSIEMHIHLGNALVELGNFDEAIEYFRMAVDLNPTILDNQYKLIQALESQGQLDEAIEASQKAIQLFSKLERKNAVDKLQRYIESLRYKKPER